MSFHIRVDAKATLGWFDAMHTEAPKAIAIAINRTAEDGLAVIWRNVKAGFTIRTLPRNFVAPQVLPKAMRADDRKGKLWALIEPHGAGRILDPFETGEPHTRDRLGRPVAIPSTGFTGLRRTKQTVIPRKLYPANLGLQVMRDPKGTLYYATGKGAKKRGISGPKPKRGRYGTYEIQGRKGPLIFQRMGPGQGNSRLLWSLQDSVPRPANLKFYAGVQEAVDQRWEANISGAFDAAVRHSDRQAARGYGK